jgi:DNA-binding MarR family transcriptional regulator
MIAPAVALARQVRDTCMCLHVQRAARAVARRYDEALRPVDLTNGQFSLLMSLNRDQPPSIGETARLLGMDRTTLTAYLKPLARRGLLETTVDRTDKRSRVIALTRAGRRILGAAVPLWREAQAQTERLVASRLDALRTLAQLV